MLRTAQSTLFLDDFIPKNKQLLKSMELEGSKPIPTKHALRKIILSYKQDFQHFSISYDVFIDTIINN